MDAAALLPLLTVFAAVTVVLFLVTGGLHTKPTDAGSNKGNGVLGRLTSPGRAPGFPSALVAATAAATALSTTGAEPFSAGALLGVLTTALNLGALAPVRKILYATAGVTGTIATLTANHTPVPGCTPPGALGTWFTILLATIAATAALAGWFTTLNPAKPLAFFAGPTTPLAFFAALTVILFLGSPLGVPAFDTTNAALAAGTAIIAAAVFGYGAGRWPAPVTGLATIAISLTAIGTAAFVIPACQTILNGNQAYTLIAFTAVYTLIHLSLTPLRRKTRAQ